MTGAGLKAWRERLGLKSAGAALTFGVSADTWTRWEQRKSLPPYVALACAAISYGLKPME